MAGRRAKQVNIDFYIGLEAAISEYIQLVEAKMRPNIKSLIKNYDLNIKRKTFFKHLAERKVFTYTQYIKQRNEKIVKAYKEGGNSLLEVLKHFSDFDKRGVQQVLLRHGIFANGYGQKALENSDQIIYLYTKKFYSIAQISKKTGINQNLVRGLLKNKKIKIRTAKENATKYKPHHDYFKIIDSEKKAWVLGFIFADGSINGMINLSVTQRKEHQHILELIKEELSYQGKLSFSTGGHNPDGIQAHLILNSREICEDLKKLGMTEKKEEALYFPFSIPDTLYTAFLAGYFNGDGSITIQLSKRKSWILNGQVRFSGTKLFCESILQVLLKRYPSRKFKIREEKGRNAWALVSESGPSSAIEIIREFAKAGYGIQIDYKFDRVAMMQRWKRRTLAVEMMLEHRDANMLKNMLKAKECSLKKEGILVREIAQMAGVLHNSSSTGDYRKYVAGKTYPKTEKVIQRLEYYLGVPRHKFIDWKMLEEKGVIERAWEYRDLDFNYKRKRINQYGDVVLLT